MSYITKLFNTPFFQNKIVLYGSLLLVLLTILRHLAANNVNAVVLIALIGLVMSYFSKNMIIVLLTAFTSVFLLEMLGYRGVMEGMKAEKDADANADVSKAKVVVTKDKVDAKDKDKDKDKAKDKDTDEADADEEKPIQQEGISTSKKITKTKTKQGMATLSPASYDGKDHDADEGDGVKGSSSANRIDYASTLEQAYDNIETIIGEDGVRGLTDQTKSLMNQQKELMNNMKEMGPLLKSAEGFMEQLTGGGGIGGITSMLQGFVKPNGDKKTK
jgi:hypothetical protein